MPTILLDFLGSFTGDHVFEFDKNVLRKNTYDINVPLVLNARTTRPREKGAAVGARARCDWPGRSIALDAQLVVAARVSETDRHAVMSKRTARLVIFQKSTS